MSSSTPSLDTTECQFCKEISEAGKHSKPPQLSQRGKIMLGIAGSFVAGVTALIAPFVIPGFRRFALPYMPASEAQVKHVLQALKGRSGSLIDIGSGDGRITILAAKNGFRSYGVEINRWLVLYSQWVAWRQGLHTQATFFKKDLWKTNLEDYQNVVIFGVETMMPTLEAKLAEEMPNNTAVVACRFPLPTWEPVQTIGDGIDTVWLYLTPISKIGEPQNRHTQPESESNNIEKSSCSKESSSGS